MNKIIIVTTLISAVLAAPVPRATAHENQVLFGYDGVTITNAQFTFNNQYSITGGQPWNGLSVTTEPIIQSTAAFLSLTADCGRKDSTAPASWFGDNASAFIGANAFTTGLPSKLNFAFQGTLTVNSDTYQIVIGQGSNSDGNNWWVGGQGWIQNSPAQISTPDNKYNIQIVFNSDGIDDANNNFGLSVN